jgi:hypothetical protein
MLHSFIFPFGAIQGQGDYLSSHKESTSKEQHEKKNFLSEVNVDPLLRHPLIQGSEE